MKPLYNKEKKKSLPTSSLIHPPMDSPPSWGRGAVHTSPAQGAYYCTFLKNHDPGMRALWLGQPAEVRQTKTALIGLISKDNKTQVSFCSNTAILVLILSDSFPHSE